MNKMKREPNIDELRVEFGIELAELVHECYTNLDKKNKRKWPSISETVFSICSVVGGSIFGLMGKVMTLESRIDKLESQMKDKQ